MENIQWRGRNNLGVTGKELKVVSTKWLPISFSHEKIDEFMHPFVIVSEPDQFLLS